MIEIPLTKIKLDLIEIKCIHYIFWLITRDSN